MPVQVPIVFISILPKVFTVIWGMVTESDVVIALSNSGETGEVLHILPSLRRIGAKLIAMVGNAESSLAKNF